MDSQVQDVLIVTAIVIKNIPFKYPENDFIDKLFPSLKLVPPYAFNYHRNTSDGNFHGLAFANFITANEAQAAVEALNNYELNGRPLRVELKKRLSAEEEQRERLAKQLERQRPCQDVPSPIQQSMAGSRVQSQQLDIMSNALHMLHPTLQPSIWYRELTAPTPQTGNTSV